MVNSYKVTKEIFGVKYTAQFVSAATAYDAIDASTMANGARSERKYAEFILEHVIVEPKMKLEDFKNTTISGEVISFGQAVMQGELEDKADKEKKSKAEE